ncbi:TetR family transcriptional regulator [Pseudonocardia kongjuensis]|uniref:TetR family transcriptional regulator n=1 Tax=Pseudonocardia kongjuensis TaxID=102227 RepID=A0ABP4I9V4_9PSEU
MGGALDRQAILAATETALRRHGPDKTTVVDVARSLGVSHGSVYRHFPSKTALREAVTRRWLESTHQELAVIAADPAVPPPERLRSWLTCLFSTSREQATRDPQLHATYWALVTEQSDVRDEHVADLTRQIRGILAAGVGDGSIAVADPAVTARAIVHATARFHHPAHAHAWRTRPTIAAEFDDVAAIVVRAVTRGGR